MTKYSGSGWHFQHIRHSNARKYGKAGGIYANKPLGIMKSQRPSLSKIDLMFKWEQMNPEYMEEQMQGLIMEISRPKEHQDLGYIKEKLRNIKNHFNYTFDNFAKRIEVSELQKEFLKEVEEERKHSSITVHYGKTEAVTKEEFEAYEAVRASGVTNMFAVNVVERLSGLSREKIIQIMEHYSELMKEFPDVRRK
jgi:hypothetical protein